MEDCFIAQIAPSPKISGDDRNDERREWLIEKLRHPSLYKGWGTATICGFYFFLFAEHNLTIVKTTMNGE